MGLNSCGLFKDALISAINVAIVAIAGLQKNGLLLQGLRVGGCIEHVFARELN